MPNDFYLIDYLKDNYDTNAKVIDYLKYELDQRIYYYGQHFKSPKEKLNNNESITRDFISRLKGLLKETILEYKEVVNNKSVDPKKKIISSAYFNFNAELQKLGYNVYRPIWDASDKRVLTNAKIYKYCRNIGNAFNNSDFNYLISNEFAKEVLDFKYLLIEFYTKQHVEALFIAHDMGFYEKLQIDIFKEMNKPSFIYHHGGMAIAINIIDDNRSNYLVTWGNKTKEHHIKCGFDPNKIFVAGHPYYQNITNQELSFSFDNILVITKSLNGGRFSSGEYRIGDRGNLILYLYSIQKVLQRLRVKKVRIRPHPSESLDWYLKFIDTSFYSLDTNPSFVDTLKNTSLVIGSPSTTIIETLYHDVNFVVYEPQIDNYNLINFPIQPPIDGSDDKLPVAKNEDDLEYILRNRIKVQKSFLNDYLKTPFDINFISELI